MMARRKNMDIGFVGGGNMAEALIRGLVSAGWEASRIAVSEPLVARRRLLTRRYGIQATADTADLSAGCPMLLLAVKPQIMGEVLAALAGLLSPSQLVISIAAGVRIKRIEAALGKGSRVVRVMPNTPCLVGRGASVLCAGNAATAADLKKAKAMFTTVGKAWICEQERQLDAVTGLSGSGPAYVYLFAEALIRGGKAAGLSSELASELAFQTIAGAAEMMAASGQAPAELRKAVSSPGGTTVAGLARLEQGDFSRTVAAAVKTATKRSRELGRK